jgi:four helix bundle protein
MVLNIAEGNGRFSESDQRRFLGGAHESAIKMAANLDLCVAQKALPREDADKCKTLLARVACMTAKMAGGAEYEDRQGSRQSSRQGLNRIDSDVEKAILTT